MAESSRRNFIRLFSGAMTGLPFLHAANPSFAAEAIQRSSVGIQDSSSFATDEDFWGWIREAYTVSPTIINLNNGTFKVL